MVRRAILALRDRLRDIYHQQPGPKRILYHLHQDDSQHACSRLPTSTNTFTSILHKGGRIADRLQLDYQPLPRHAPMVEWELNLGLVTLGADPWLEFCPIVDSGMSIWVASDAPAGFDSEV